MNLRAFFTSLFILPVCLFASDNMEMHHGDSSHHHHHQEAQVGPLQIASVVVPNLDAAMTQWSAGTGTEFGPVTEQVWVVHLKHGDSQNVTLRSASSVRSAPFLQLVQANPPIGPWAPQFDAGSVPGYQVYAANNINKVGEKLESAGMKKVAHAYLKHHSDSKFAIYEGFNGLLVQLITNDLVPTGGVNIPQAPIDLGPIAHVDLSVQDLEAVNNQLAQALSLEWVSLTFNDVPFSFPGGVYSVDSTILVSSVTPIIEVEFISPPLGVWATTKSSYNFHISYKIPAGTMEVVNAQMLSAGYTLNTFLGTPALGMVLAFYVNADNVWIEVVDERFDL